MRFKIDENLPDEICDLLNAKDHDASSVHHQKIEGSPDDILINICKREKRTLVTLDTDFSDIRTYPPQENYGIILLRIRNQSKNNVLFIFGQVISQLETELVDKQLWIVEENKIRIRE